MWVNMMCKETRHCMTITLKVLNLDYSCYHFFRHLKSPWILWYVPDPGSPDWTKLIFTLKESTFPSHLVVKCVILSKSLFHFADGVILLLLLLSLHRWDHHARLDVNNLQTGVGTDTKNVSAIWGRKGKLLSLEYSFAVADDSFFSGVPAILKDHLTFHLPPAVIEGFNTASLTNRQTTLPPNEQRQQWGIHS